MSKYLLVQNKKALIRLVAKDALGTRINNFYADKTRFQVTDVAGHNYPISSLTWDSSGNGLMEIDVPNSLGDQVLIIKLDGFPIISHPTSLEVTLVKGYQGRFDSTGAAILTDGAVYGGQNVLKDFKNQLELKHFLGARNFTLAWPSGTYYNIDATHTEVADANHAGIIGARINNSSDGDYWGIGLDYTNTAANNIISTVGGDFSLKTFIGVWGFKNNCDNNLFYYGQKHSSSRLFFVTFSRSDGASKAVAGFGMVLFVGNNTNLTLYAQRTYNGSSSFGLSSVQNTNSPLLRSPRPLLFAALRINGDPSSYTMDAWYQGSKYSNGTNYNDVINTGGYTRTSNTYPSMLSLMSVNTISSVDADDNLTAGEASMALFDFAAYPDIKSDQFIYDQAAAWGLNYT